MPSPWQPRLTTDVSQDPQADEHPVAPKFPFMLAALILGFAIPIELSTPA